MFTLCSRLQALWEPLGGQQPYSQEATKLLPLLMAVTATHWTHDVPGLPRALAPPRRHCLLTTLEFPLYGRRPGRTQRSGSWPAAELAPARELSGSSLGFAILTALQEREQVWQRQSQHRHPRKPAEATPRVKRGSAPWFPGSRQRGAGQAGLASAAAKGHPDVAAPPPGTHQARLVPRE